MAFLHTWAIPIGIAAVGLPVLIHWLTKPSPMRMPLSTIRFLQQAVKQKRTRYRLRDWLVLLLRCAAVMLLAWAFARPLAGTKPLIAAGEPGDAARVVIVDASLSMGAVTGGQTVFDRARAAAAPYLSYQPGLRGNLILAGAKPLATFDTLSTNFPLMLDTLGAATALPQRADMQAAINKAADLLAKVGGDGVRKELVVISDFQRTGWALADLSPLPQGTSIQFETVATKEPLQNVAILRAGPVGRVEVGREARIEVEVGNFSRTPRQVTIDVTAGDLALRLTGMCPPGTRTTLSGTGLPKQPGWLVGEARLVDARDALPTDDTRPIVLHVRPSPTYALLTRQSARPHASSSHYVERALVPAGGDEKSISERVVRIDATKPDRDALSTASLIVIDHPGKLSTETATLLAGLARRGRGILYMAAEPNDATNLRLITDAAGADMKLPVEFIPPAANVRRSDLFMLEWKKDQAPFSATDETMRAVAGQLRFGGGLMTRLAAGGLPDDVLATFSDRSAALVVTTCGAGSVAVLNAELTASSLPSSPLFVPLMGELVNRLLSGSGTNNRDDAVASGEPLAVQLPPETTGTKGLSAVDPKGEEIDTAVASIIEEGPFVLWRQMVSGPPGVYRVVRGNETIYAQSVAPPAVVESDLATLDPETLKTRIATGRSVYVQGAGDEPPKDHAWAWILVACATCMIVELGVLKGFKT